MAPEYSTCPRCDGTGRYRRLGFPARPCAVCDGTGLVGPDGTGKADVACPDCGPVRVVPVSYDGGRPVAGDCPRCRATLFFA